MSETRDFLKRMKEEGLIRADVACGKEHVVIHEKGVRQDSKAFQQVRTQLMNRTKVGNRTFLYILAGVFVVAILISFIDSNISGFYRSLFFSAPKSNEATIQDNANLSTAALTALDSTGKSRELIRAVQNGDSSLVQKLLGLEADINGTDEKGNTPLVAAINSGKKEIAGLLLDNGASLNAVTENGITPVMAAAQNGNPLLLDRLLKNG
ncbi:MAG: ankyrin repeat domain-containing protein, partial [Holophagae bacterium]|nr:ankyrin repeat domain-containing protein [Holophagae bacterium]